MCAFYSFHVKVESTRFWVGANSSIAGVGEGAGLAIAESGDIMFVAAEVLLFGGSAREKVSRMDCRLKSFEGEIE